MSKLSGCSSIAFKFGVVEHWELSKTHQRPLGKFNTSKYLILNTCSKLTHLQGLDFVETLVEVNISSNKILSIAFGLNHDRPLQMCGLRGSQSTMIYNNNWWKVLLSHMPHYHYTL